MTLPPFDDELPKIVTHDQMPSPSAPKLGFGLGIYFSSSFLILLKISTRF